MQRLVLVSVFAALTSAAAAAAPDERARLEVEDAAVRIRVIPERRADVVVEVRQSGAGLPPLQVRRVGAAVLVDGGLERDQAVLGWNGGLSCGPEESVRVRGRTFRGDELPTIIARVPLDADVAAGGAVFGDVAASRNLTLVASGCGRWRVADVDGGLKLAQHGSGRVDAGGTGRAAVRLAGSGAATLGRVRSGLEVDLAGSGAVRVSRSDGPLDVTVAGSGDVEVASGSAPIVNVRIAGSGDVTFGGEAGELRARTNGSGDVAVARVRGRVDAVKHGSGEVRVAHAAR